MVLRHCGKACAMVSNSWMVECVSIKFPLRLQLDTEELIFRRTFRIYSDQERNLSGKSLFTSAVRFVCSAFDLGFERGNI